MNIRKHWKKFVLAASAIFWVSCGDDNGTSTSVIPVVPDSSATTDPAEESSSAEVPVLGESSSSMEAVQESSSSDALAACGDTKQFPLAVENSDLRCTGKLADTLFTCCDGSVIKSPKYTVPCYGSYYGNIPDSVPAYLLNDTLFTKQGRKIREAAVKAESKRLSDLREASIIDSLNNASEFCNNHGGIQSRTTFDPKSYTVSSSECSRLTESASKSLYDETIRDTSLLDAVIRCIKNSDDCVFGYCEAPLYGVIYQTCYDSPSGSAIPVGNLSTPSATEKSGSNAKFDCADGTTEETEAYIAAQKELDEAKEKCNSPSEEALKIIEKCKAEGGNN